MAIDISRIRDNIHKLRRSLKKARRSSRPGAVHKLRTRTKTFEAAAEAFSVTSKRRLRHILSSLKRIRKKVGRVRDMDVLILDLLTIHASGERKCMVRLSEYLGAKRRKQAARLRRLANRFGPGGRKRLKKVEKRLLEPNGKLSHAKQMQFSEEAAGFTLQHSRQLQQPATLNRSNLHEFRLKIKELKYVLKMAEGNNRERFLEALDKCKDAIGEWHDWEAIASDVLDHGRGCRLMQQLKKVAAAKFDLALSMTNKMRRMYAGRKRTHGPNKQMRLGPSVQKVASAISSATGSKRKIA